MSDSSLKRCNCHTKTISFKEIKLWCTAYLRLNDKPTNRKLFEEFKLDLEDYKKHVRDYFDDFNKNCNTTLRVAFLSQPLEFPGDPYFKVDIYLEFTERNRYFESQKGTAAPGDLSGPPGPDGGPTGAGETKTPDTNDKMDIQGDVNWSGPGTVTPPRCPPDVPPGRVSRVSYAECG